MSKKPKLLWIGDFAAKTGFGRVSGALLPHLKNDYEIVVIGCNWHGDPTPEQEEFKIYPASNRFQQAPFGEDRILEIVEREEPDIICTLNDPWIASEQYKRVQHLHQQGKFKFIGYLTMDSYDWVGGVDPHVNQWDALISFTEFGAYEFVKAGVRKPLAVIPHGLDPEVFYPMDKSEARKQLNLSDDIFIVFNGQRNQPRKRIDITIDAFAKFAKDKPDAQLYLHMGLKDQGWDVMGLFAKEMQKNGLDPNGRIILTCNNPNPPNVEVDVLRAIYSCADVGVNTCKGGGWELVNFEQAACRVAQVVPDHTSTKEIFEGAGKLIRCDHIDVDPNYCRSMPCPSSDHLVEILNNLYWDRDSLKATADSCYDRVTEERFSWDVIGKQFSGVFQEVLEGRFQEHDLDAEAEVTKPKRKDKKRKKQLIGV